MIAAVPSARVARTVVTALAACALHAAALVAQAPPAPVDTLPVTDLPLVELAATQGVTANADRFVVLLTGDGDWAALVRDVAGQFAARGMPVVGLKARSYMKRGRDAEVTTRDVSRVVETYAARWGRPHVLLVGYSRGADWLPFVLARGGERLRERTKLVGMLAMAERAKFSFSLFDMVRSTSDPSDPPIAPELAKLRGLGLPLACVYGVDEEETGCKGADPALMTVFARAGGHHFDSDAAAIVTQLLTVMKR
jgi:type IV secretory pathway VirJ component